jgi:hypothetical protein
MMASSNSHEYDVRRHCGRVIEPFAFGRASHLGGDLAVARRRLVVTGEEAALAEPTSVALAPLGHGGCIELPFVGHESERSGRPSGTQKETLCCSGVPIGARPGLPSVRSSSWAAFAAAPDTAQRDGGVAALAMWFDSEPHYSTRDLNVTGGSGIVATETEQRVIPSGTLVVPLQAGTGMSRCPIGR